MLILGLLPPVAVGDLFFWNTIMFSRLMMALIAVEKRSKWLFDRKKLSGAEFCGHMIKGNIQCGHLSVKGCPLPD